jgi:hypothetical protein
MDNQAVPLSRVYVQVHDLPNAVGSFYSVGQWTDASGTTRISAIPAGRRRVEATVPNGFRAGPNGNVTEVDVVKGAAVTVVFLFVRS